MPNTGRPELPQPSDSYAVGPIPYYQPPGAAPEPPPADLMVGPSNHDPLDQLVADLEALTEATRAEVYRNRTTPFGHPAIARANALIAEARAYLPVISHKAQPSSGLADIPTNRLLAVIDVLPALSAAERVACAAVHARKVEARLAQAHAFAARQRAHA